MSKITGQRLVDLEQKFGGIQRVEHMKGGDRMLYRLYKGKPVSRGYAPIYAKYLPKKIDVLVELGILRGTGLAIWSDIYQDARVIGLDKNLLHFKEYKASLRAFGGFKYNDTEVYEFDKFDKKAQAAYSQILGNDKIDVFIDDSNHSIKGILKAFADVKPFLSKKAVCFFEDNDEVGQILKNKYPEYELHIEGRMTVIQL